MDALDTLPAVKSVKKWYQLYVIFISLNFLEEWEIWLFNSLLIAFLAMASYTTYLFLPGHLVMLRHYADYFFGTSDTGVGTATVPTAPIADAPPAS